MIDGSSSTLRVFPLEPGDELVDLRELGCDGLFDARRPPVSVRYLGDVPAPYAQSPRDAAVHSIGEFFSVNEGVHKPVSCVRDKRPSHDVPSEDADYPHWDNVVKKKIRKILLPEVSSPIGERIRMIRKERGLSQAELASLLGFVQSRVAKWEKGALAVPGPVLLKISELVPDGDERQWWRDQAARIAGFTEAAVTGVPLSTASQLRTIPLIKNPLKVGDLGPVDVAEVQENLQLPQHWFAEGGTIRAVAIKNNPLSPLIAGEHIAIIDVSRRDPDRLIGCVVATRTVTGIEARLLRKDRNVYFLQPLNETSGQSIRTLKHDGEDSIVGQVLKWIADAPSPAQKRKYN